MADDDTQTDAQTDNGAATGDAPAGDGQTAQKPPQMQVLGQFVRDMSFENIASQKGLKTDAQPEIGVQVGIDARKRTTEGQYDVTLKVKVKAKAKGTEDVIFALDVDYTGIFAVANVPEAQLHPYLLIECPRMLFPFLRRIVHDVTRDGGFPPLNLEQIDWVALYRQQLAQRAQAEAAQATKS